MAPRAKTWMAGSSPAMTALSKRLGVTFDHALQLPGEIVGEIAAVTNDVEDLDVLATQQRQQTVFESAHLVERQRNDIAVGTGPEQADLLIHLQRRQVRLHHEFCHQLAPLSQAVSLNVCHYSATR